MLQGSALLQEMVEGGRLRAPAANKPQRKVEGMPAGRPAALTDICHGVQASDEHAVLTRPQCDIHAEWEAGAQAGVRCHRLL